MTNEIPHYSWSFSSLGLFECPKRYEIMRAKKLLSEPSGAAANEGTRVHDMIEAYLKEDKWNSELLKWKRLLTVYKEKNGLAEEEYVFKFEDKVSFENVDELPKYRRNLVRTEWKDKRAWFRAKLDFVKIDGKKAEVADWKTGKVKITKQLQFYAWVIFLAHPEVEEVKCTFHWINYNDQASEWYTRKDFESGKLFQPFGEILEQIDDCYRSDLWPENPGQIGKQGRGSNCRFCLVTNEHCSNGITVEEYNRKHEEAKGT